jgi:hypothetical protein
MGQAISPYWIVNMLALDKDPWHFKYLGDQLNMYRQQRQSYQQKKIIAKMAINMPGKSNNRKRKKCERNPHNKNGGRGGSRQGNNGRGGRGG